MNIYVGNLSLAVTEEELRREFRAFGEVVSVNIMNDKYIGSGQQRGYAFVEMSIASEGETAVRAINGKELGNMAVNVVEALPLSNHTGKEYLHGRKPSHFGSRVRERSQESIRQLE